LGVGLAIVRSLVERHGGTVEARSAGAGAGSEMVVWLPLASDAPRLAPPVRSESTAVAGRRRILVVDDNDDAAETLAELLRMLGHEVEVATDGPSALARVDAFVPDLGLVDLGLPVMDGFEVARRLRATVGLEGIPLVAVTGYGQERDRVAAREAGFDELLVKPV